MFSARDANQIATISQHDCSQYPTGVFSLIKHAALKGRYNTVVTQVMDGATINTLQGLGYKVDFNGVTYKISW